MSNPAQDFLLMISPKLKRLPGGTLLAAFVLLGGVILASTQASTSSREDTEGAKNRVQQWREGLELKNEPGHFRMTGDRVTFFTDDGNGRFVALENLNLQRVAEHVEDNPELATWIVSGAVTEFRGSNYLLITRAVMERQ